MTLNEFKAWFEGFSEGINKVPSEKQFAKIKSKISEINDTPISYPIFVDRYVRPYRNWFETYGPAWASTGDPLQNVGVAHIVDENSLVKFDSRSAMYAAGRAEFQSLAA